MLRQKSITLVETKTAKEILQNNIVDKGLVLKEEIPKSKNIECNFK